MVFLPLSFAEASRTDPLGRSALFCRPELAGESQPMGGGVGEEKKMPETFSEVRPLNSEVANVIKSPH